MAKTAMQRVVEKNTGQSRYTSGAATKNRQRSERFYRNFFRRKSQGGQGG